MVPFCYATVITVKENDHVA
ncbi:membrane protein YoeI [Shigella flexneri]